MVIPESIIDLQNLRIKNYRRVWQPFMEKYNCQKICEVGVYEGDNFELMIAHKPKLAVAIDPWQDDEVASHNDSGHTQEELDNQYHNFVQKMVDKPFVKILRMYSFDTVYKFPDEYFDLIYIDADHTYEASLKDVSNWYLKVKTGGFLTGDDYRVGHSHGARTIKIGVKEAVDQFAQAHNLDVYELPRRGWAIIK